MINPIASPNMGGDTSFFISGLPWHHLLSFNTRRLESDSDVENLEGKRSAD